MEQTSRIIRPILEFLFPTASEDTILVYHSYIRKSAHFAEYSVLAFLAFRAYSSSTISLFREHRHLLSITTVLLIALIDEFNQSFEASRTGSILDVLLDLSGGVVMVTVLWLFFRPWPSAAE